MSVVFDYDLDFDLEKALDDSDDAFCHLFNNGVLCGYGKPSNHIGIAYKGFKVCPVCNRLICPDCVYIAKQMRDFL